MTENPSENNQPADFQQWTQELYGGQGQTQNRSVVLGRVSLNEQGQAILDPDTDYEVPVDEFGMPLTVRGFELTERQQQDLRWDAVLLDYPYTPPSRRGKHIAWAFWLGCRAQSLRRGQGYRDEETDDYVRQWEAAGFSPELYALLCNRIPQAVRALEICYSSDEQRAVIARRLRELCIDLEDKSLARWNLVPQHWAQLPYLLTRVRPSVAVQWIIYMKERDSH